MSVNVQLSLGNFPPGYCWTNPQQFGNDLVSLILAQITGNFSGIIIGSSLPSAGDQDKAWLRTNNDGTPDKLFKYLGGWLALNPTPPSSSELRLWQGAEASVWSYDGGDGTDPGTAAPTATSGAMWQVEHAMDFRIPMGPGTSPNTYDGNPATVLNQGGTAGEERHTLTLPQIPAHSHDVPLYAGDATNHADRINTTDELTVQDLSYQSGSAGGGQSHQNLPPVKGVFFIRRTARIFYVAS
jgi:hypothetical protein